MLQHVTRYVFPTSVRHAVDALSAPNAAIIAGGTSLVPARAPGVHTLVDITRLGLDAIQEDGDGIRIGACVTLQRLADAISLLGYLGGVVGTAAAASGGRLLRNGATIGGALASCDPRWDVVGALLASDAILQIEGPAGSASVPLEDFLARKRGALTERGGEGGPDGLSPFSRPLGGHLLTEVHLPAPERGTIAGFEKLVRTSLDDAIVASTFRFTLRDRVMQDCRVVLCGVSERPTRVRFAETKLNGKPPTEDSIANAADLVAQNLEPPDDIRGTSEYRRAMAIAIARRAMQRALLASTRW